MRPSGWGLLRAPLRAQRQVFWRLAAWSAVEAVPVLVSGHLIARALDTGFLDGRFAVGVAWLLLYGAAMITGAFATRAAVPLVAAVVEAVRDALIRVVVTGGLQRAVRSTSAPDTSTVARIAGHTEVAREVVAGLLFELRVVVFSTGAAVIGLVTLAPQLAVVVLPAVAVAGVALTLLLRALAGRQRRVLAAEEQLSESAGTVFSAVRDIVACGARGRASREVGDDIEAHRRATMAVARLGSCRVLVVTVGARVPLLAALLLAPWLISRGSLAPGELIGVATYLVRGLEPALRSLVDALGQMGLQLQVVLGRLASYAQAPPLPAHGSSQPRGADLSVEHASFAYGPHAEPVFRDLSLEIPYGEHLAVVGPSGAGKSTLANLLARVCEPQRGRVAIGGIDLAEIDEGWLRRTVAILPQESYVFAGTVRENLSYLRPGAADRDLDASVAALGAEPVVDRLGGYDAVIEHPASLSAGERQRIALTRVHLSAARIVVLDEATCHLDPSSERLAEEAFTQREGTLIVVAHRISSALRAQRVLILEGADHAIGDHETLLTRSPLYAELVGHWTAVR